MGVLHQSRGKGHAAARTLGGVMSASQVAKQPEDNTAFEPIHDISHRPQFTGLSGELGMASSRMPIQAKMIVGDANDRYEQEADRLAPQIVHRINMLGGGEQTQALETDTKDATPSIQLQSLQPTLQLKGESTRGVVSPVIESSITSARSGGQPLETGLQERFGQAMGADFRGVTVHTDATADRLNQSIQSKAFTTKQDIFFRRGAYNPGSQKGQELIAHELIHVVQQKQEHAAPDVSRIVDRSGNLVTKERAPKDLRDKIKAFKKKLPNGGAHQKILSYLEEQVENRIGKGRAGIQQFYKGAHIVFNDKGEVYRKVEQLGAAIAVRDNSGRLKSKKDFVGNNILNELPYYSPEDRQRMRAGAMFARRPNTGETSHYEHEVEKVYEHDPLYGQLTDEEEEALCPDSTVIEPTYKSHDFGWNAHAAPPQLGIDFPLEAGGHVLVGIVPPRTHAERGDEGSVGNTFVQTEGAGFQSFWQGVPMHLLGGFRNWGWLPGVAKGTQTGLLGQTSHSEKTLTEIREVDNPKE